MIYKTLLRIRRYPGVYYNLAKKEFYSVPLFLHFEPYKEKRWQNILSSQSKYYNMGYHFILEWNYRYSSPFDGMNDSRLRWFQYWIFLRYIVTDTFLYKINYINSYSCDLWRHLQKHLFCDCYYRYWRRYYENDFFRFMEKITSHLTLYNPRS